MPTESCYVTLIENAILLCVAYGLLSSYFEDVLHYGFLFFGVFIGLCACYACTATGFCMMLLDDATSTQLALLDADRPFTSPPPNNIAHVARILARTATTCSVALFVLFVTVGCEFFTEDSALATDSLPTIALKRNVTESALATQIAVSTAFAVYFVLVLMLLGSNQQLNGIFLRLQYMTQSVPMSPAQAAAFTTTADDVALFVRVLLGLYMVTCGSTGTFKSIPYKSVPSFLLDSIPGLKADIGEMRNGVALLFIGWCFVTDTLRAFLPPMLILIGLLEILDVLQVFGSVLVVEVLLGDSTLTNFACAVLVICDAACVVYASVTRIYQKVRSVTWSRAQRSRQNLDANDAFVPKTSENESSESIAFKTNTNDQDQTTTNDPRQVTPGPNTTDKNSDCCCQCQRPHSCCECRRPNTATADALSANGRGTSLHFSGAHVNIDKIKMHVFEKKYI
jgi:hypothetical protein